MKSKKLQEALQKFNQKASSANVEPISEIEEFQIVGGVGQTFLANADCDAWGGSCDTWGGSCGTWG